MLMMAGATSTREFDLIVLGATGFTGQRVLEYLLNLKEAQHLNIAAAGRSVERIQRLHAVQDAPRPVQVLSADTERPDQLSAIAAKTTILLNCVGPYRYSGEAVVSACVSTGTHYLDVSGEPEFMERAELLFVDEAKSRKCFVVSACGFDSIPADIGTLLVQQKFAVPSSVEAFHVFSTTAKSFRINYATWESAVHGFGTAGKLRELRKMRHNSGMFSAPSKPAGPKLRPPQSGNFESRIGSYVVPFPAWRLGRLFLLNFPELFSFGIFSRKGPSLEQMRSTSFKTILIGRGYDSGVEASSGNPPNKEARLEIRGPDPGYIATPILLVQTALTLLKERDAIVSRLGEGGVFTPGALLHKTSFSSRIQEAGIEIRFITK